MKTIIGIGEILWDIFPERKKLGGAPLILPITLRSSVLGVVLQVP